MNVLVITGALITKRTKQIRYGLMFWGTIRQLKAVKDGKGGLDYIPVDFNVKAYNVVAEALQTTIKEGDMITIYGELESYYAEKDNQKVLQTYVLAHNINKVVTLDKLTLIDNQAQADLNFVTAKTKFGQKFKRTYKQNRFMRKQDEVYGQGSGETGSL